MKRVVLLPALLAAATALAGTPLQTCRLRGVEHDALCGEVRRALDPTRVDGVQIDVRFAVLPALARNKLPDPVFFLAGGPGQSAIDLAGPLSARFARLSNRRDIVLVDQRGTGRSAPLMCEEADPTRPLRELFDPARQRDKLRRCREALAALPHGDLRQYTTTIAMADLDAVRRALGAERINLVGASYGTRAALEYGRQFPHAVRRTVLDGMAPPDMVLPAASAVDVSAAFEALLAACDSTPRCRQQYPMPRAQWQRLLTSLPSRIVVSHPFTGRDEVMTLTADMLAGLVRQPLYAPWVAAALPAAIDQASAGRFGALFGLASAMAGPRGVGEVAEGMHFSVICSEDYPLMNRDAVTLGNEFGDGMAALYRAVCSHWPQGEVPAAFYRIGAAAAPVLALSGGLDPATPPRHGARVVEALGALARHVVVSNAGHGVMGIGCMPDVLFRFIDADDAAQALAVDAACAEGIPRPPVFVAEPR